MAIKSQRGDTLVEVLMAVVILSLVIVGAITMMSRGLSAAQIAVEHTQVRQSINGQTEMLRYLRDAYLLDKNGSAAQAWESLFSGSSLYANNVPSSYGGACAVTANKTGFYLEQSGSNVNVIAFDSANKPTTVALPGQGLWIEATRSASGISPAYVDFQIRACWQGVGSSAEQQTVTVERLYDPAH
ncbi:MAG: prepilin-type N-terminal cleavage/methylation domain-containing protein [Candidatus Woesebacteria bacterium]|jgi:prepilin-type N-terminal cleavage/methylation domain-containing protein